VTSLPSINAIRNSLSEVSGALVDDPWTSPVDLGDTPSVPIHEPEPNTLTRSSLRGETVEGNLEEEPSIIFEIPPELDDRVVAEALSESGGRNVEALIRISGVDALGWYVPFHYRVAQHGIYISSAGALWLAQQCFKRQYSANRHEDLSRKLHYAIQAILRHETFHFAAECMAANWELVTGAPCYTKAVPKLKSAAGYIEHEEALANAYMLRGFRWASSPTRGAQATQALKTFIRKQPPGYRDGIEYAGADEYAEGCRDLAADYQTCMPRRWWAPRDTFENLGLYPNITQIDWRRCPIILVDESKLFGKLGIIPRFIGSIPSIEETEPFRKQLARLGSRYQALWTSTKRKLANTTSLKGLDFKVWPPRGMGWYSVRLDRNIRAHLRNDASNRLWYAEEVGPHGVMGH
jgi:hypothetical protein